MKLKIETRIKTLATIRSVVLVCLVFAAGSVLAETQIQVGDTRQEVLRLMGTPVGEGAVGKRELLNYARGDAVVLENGKVVEIRMDGEIITADSIARNEAMESQSAASLGKTKAFCRRKYGEALKSSSTGSMEITMYVHDGWLIKIVFLADIAHRIDYHILEPESSSNILDEEFLAMLDRQADGMKWEKQKDDGSEDEKWLRTDAARAYKRSRTCARFETPVIGKYLEASQDQTNRRQVVAQQKH